MDCDVNFRIEDRRPDESVPDYTKRALAEIHKVYENIAKAEVIQPKSKGTTLGEYLPSIDAIAYYNNENITTFEDVLDTFFHENAHAAIEKGIISRNLGNEINDEPIKQGIISEEDRRADIDILIEAGYSEDEISEELTTNYLAQLFRGGAQEEFVKSLPANLAKQLNAYEQAITKQRLQGNGNEGSSGNARNDQEVPEASAGISAGELGDGEVRFSVRTKPAPEKTGIGYKVFYLKDGRISASL